MKRRTTDVLLIFLSTYVVVAALNRFGPEGFPTAPVSRQVTSIRNQKWTDESGTLTRDQIEEIVSGMTWKQQGRNYFPIVEGEGDTWTLTLKPQPLTFAKRAWYAVSSWKLNPRSPSTLSISSTNSVIWTTFPDGSGFGIGGRGSSNREEGEPK